VKQLEKPSSARAETLGGDQAYNRRHREVARSREGGGWVRSSDEAG
jgi:hypothetical protein